MLALGLILVEEHEGSTPNQQEGSEPIPFAGHSEREMIKQGILGWTSRLQVASNHVRK